MINDEIIYRLARSRQINCENIESRGRNDVVSIGVEGGFVMGRLNHVGPDNREYIIRTHNIMIIYCAHINSTASTGRMSTLYPGTETFIIQLRRFSQRYNDGGVYINVLTIMSTFIY